MIGLARDKAESEVCGGKGGLYANGVYQTQLDIAHKRSVWNGCLSLGVDEWLTILASDAETVQVVDLEWRVTHRFEVDEGLRIGRIEETANGERFLVPLKAVAL